MTLLSEQIQQLIDYKGGAGEKKVDWKMYEDRYGESKPKEKALLLRCLEIVEILELDSRISPALYKLLEPLP